MLGRLDMTLHSQLTELVKEGLDLVSRCLLEPSTQPEAFAANVLEDEGRGWQDDWFHAHSSVGDQDATMTQCLGNLGAGCTSDTVNG